MRKRLSVLSIGLVLLGLLVLSERQVNASSIFFTPATSNALTGDILFVNLDFQDLGNLFSYRIAATYDPSLLILRGITVGNFFLTSITPGGSVSELVNPNVTPGQLEYFGTLFPGGTRTNSSGTEWTIQFEALTPGTSPLTLTTIELFDSFNNPIPFDFTNGTVNIADVGSLPEPIPAPEFTGITYGIPNFGWIFGFGGGMLGFAVIRRKYSRA